MQRTAVTSAVISAAMRVTSDCTRADAAMNAAMSAIAELSSDPILDALKMEAVMQLGSSTSRASTIVTHSSLHSHVVQVTVRRRHELQSGKHVSYIYQHCRQVANRLDAHVPAASTHPDWAWLFTRRLAASGMTMCVNVLPCAPRI